MRCKKAHDYISMAMDELLTEFQAQQLAEHLGICEECLRYQADLERGRLMLQNSMAEPPDNFEWKVQLGIQKALREKAAGILDVARPSRRYWLQTSFSAIAVAAVVVMAGFFALQPKLSSTPGDQFPFSGSGNLAAGEQDLPARIEGGQSRELPEYSTPAWNIQRVGTSPAANLSGGSLQPIGPMEGPHLETRFPVTEQNNVLYREIQLLRVENELLRSQRNRVHISPGSALDDSIAGQDKDR